MNLFRRQILIISIFTNSCSFKVEVTSQRTALENQIIGSQKALRHDMAMISSVRAVDTDGTTKKIDISQNHETALRAKQNQEFNQDDIFEFKNLGIIGETEDGLLEIVTTTSQKPNIDIPKLAEILIAEENRDRKILWKRIITSNPEIKASDIQQVQKTYAKQIYEAAPKGHWFKRNDQWTQKF